MRERHLWIQGHGAQGHSRERKGLDNTIRSLQEAVQLLTKEVR